MPYMNQFQPNPVNDFYFRNAQAQMAPQFMPYQQQGFSFPPAQPQQVQMPSIHANWVTNVEEAKAAPMGDFVSSYIFLDTDTGKIYLKRMGNDGKPQFLSYAIEGDVQKPVDPLAEINARLANIENFMGGLKNESVPGNEDDGESDGDAHAAVAGQNEPDGSAESAGVPKNAGNDFWKKRR